VAYVARVLETTRTALAWSEDGAAVTKRPTSDHHDAILGSYRDAFLNEIRVNHLLAVQPPPVPTPRLVASSNRHFSLTVEAVDGEPLAAKFPLTLAAGEVGELVRLVEALEPYRPRRLCPTVAPGRQIWPGRHRISGDVRLASMRAGSCLILPTESELPIAAVSSSGPMARLRYGWRTWGAESAGRSSTPTTTQSWSGCWVVGRQTWPEPLPDLP
jgi:hypothetical protein